MLLKFSVALGEFGSTIYEETFAPEDINLSPERWNSFSPNAQAAYLMRWFEKIPKKFNIEEIPEPKEMLPEYDKEKKLDDK
jgi:hypothetical protein